MTPKPNVAILAGGDSPEIEVSLKSGAFVESVLDKERYNVYMVIVRGRDWYVECAGQRFDIDKNRFSVTLPDKGETLFDYALIMIHGTPGENGLLQSYFELMRIPYSTCSPTASAVTFDKILSKRALSGCDVAMARDIRLNRRTVLDTEEIVKTLSLPVFVKAATSGSSFGVTKVKRAEDLPEAVRIAFEESDEVLVEECIDGTELSCGIMRHKGEFVLFPPTEIVPDGEFFDYDAKYNGKGQEITPARISPLALERLYDSMKTIYDALGMRSLVRIDFIVRDEVPYFIEVNTVPGMSPASIIPQQARAMGLSATELFDMIIEETR
ncbi:MAG: D-alanine--D-alanine ligase [Rikenellaceae bacterium]|nr:D-alanine--D-alanine ligase [Rikenellaceae bacterium]